MKTMKILIVDDMHTFRKQIELLVQKLGHTSISATSGREAIEKAREHTPDLALLDIVMNDPDGSNKDPIDGWRVCREFKKIELPTIVISTKASNLDKTRSLSNGAIAHIVKPVDEAELTHWLEKL